MTRYILIGVVLLALVGGYFIYSSSTAVTTLDTEAPETENGSSRSASGVVTNVNLDEVALDGPALITIRDTAGAEHTIAVPSMGILLCAASDSINDPYEIEAGDTVSVRGTLDEKSRIVPCEGADDHLTVTKTYTNDTLGFSFTYPAGKTGYVFEDDLPGSSEHPNFVYGIMLTDTNEYEALHAATEPREGPPTMQIRVFENVDRLSPFIWVDRNPLESNISMAFSEPEETIVGGANAAHYTADGLYATEYYAVAHGELIFLFVGMYLDENSDIAHDFDMLIDSVRFVPTGGALNDGTHLGFIRMISIDTMTLDFDVAVWLTGSAAEDAAIRAGFCTDADRGECLPNNFFIENQDEVVVPLPIDTNALVFMQTWRMEETGEVTEREIGLADFASLINDEGAHWSRLPYEVTVLGGKVERIEEVYVP